MSVYTRNLSVIALSAFTAFVLAINVVRWGNGDELFTAVASLIHWILAVAAIVALAMAPRYNNL